jgi:pullulanase/glycogen debranching enzyme
MDTLVRVSADLFEVGQIYGYRVERAALERELRFDPRKALLDPYGRAIARALCDLRDARSRLH